MPKITIAQEADVAKAVFDLDTRIFAKEERLSGEDLDRTTWWIARNEQGEAVGYAGARMFSTIAGEKPTMVYFVRAGVHPDARGHGLQRRLIQCRIKWGIKNKAKAAITYTMADNHHSSNNLIKAGFMLYHPEEAWVGREGILYWWRSL